MICYKNNAKNIYPFNLRVILWDEVFLFW
jgi:hypothetical protein